MWYLFYDTQILSGPHHDSWYLFDRFVASFIIYGIYGVAAFVYHEKVYRVLEHVRYLFLPVGLIIGLLSVRSLLAFPGDLNFGNAPYLNTIQSLYSLVIIFAVFMGASKMIVNDSPKLPLFKWLAVYAYRTYLANVFVFQVILLLFKDTLLKLPSGIMILLAYLATASCAFALSWLLHIIWSAVKKGFSK